MVGGVEARKGEDEHVGQDLPRSEQRRRESDTAAEAQAAVRARIDEKLPDEDPADRPADVLEVVQARMREGASDQNKLSGFCWNDRSRMLENLVGAAGFEPATPSPPGRGAELKLLRFFVNGRSSAASDINDLGPVL